MSRVEVIKDACAGKTLQLVDRVLRTDVGVRFTQELLAEYMSKNTAPAMLFGEEKGHTGVTSGIASRMEMEPERGFVGALRLEMEKNRGRKLSDSESLGELVLGAVYVAKEFWARGIKVPGMDLYWKPRDLSMLYAKYGDGEYSAKNPSGTYDHRIADQDNSSSRQSEPHPQQVRSSSDGGWGGNWKPEPGVKRGDVRNSQWWYEGAPPDPYTNDAIANRYVRGGNYDGMIRYAERRRDPGLLQEVATSVRNYQINQGNLDRAEEADRIKSAIAKKRITPEQASDKLRTLMKEE